MIPPARIWTCDICGKKEPWGDQWRWYGSYRTYEETGEPEFVACSMACRNDDRTKALVEEAAHRPKKRAAPHTRKPRLSEAERLRRDIEAMQKRLAEIEP